MKTGRASSTHLNPRKTPAQARSSEMVGAIIEAAARVLETNGFEGYTTNAVARRAGVSIGSLYQYFPGRDALTKALIQRETAVLIAEVAALGLEPNGHDGIVKLIRAAVAHQLRRPVLARLLDFEERRLPLDQEVEQVSASIRSILERLLIRSDMPPVSNIEQTAGDLLALVKGMIDAAGERGEQDAPGLEARVERAVFGYLQLSSKISTD
jgi:AcrR family transcriptional regulator